MIRIAQAVIVEGNYDKIKLQSITDAFIIVTNGFSIFKDKQKQEFIKKIASERGIIILTDSDYAGRQIRNFIISITSGLNVINIYTPEIYGKERRKTHPSSEGKLGVEGIDGKILKDLLKNAEVKYTDAENKKDFTASDLYKYELTGCYNSKEKRRKLLNYLDLPSFLSNSSLLNYLNSRYTYAEIENLINKAFSFESN